MLASPCNLKGLRINFFIIELSILMDSHAAITYDLVDRPSTILDIIF